VTETPVSPATGGGWAPGSTPGGGWVPVPDPTKLTTEQLRRELDQATSQWQQALNSVHDLVTARMDAMASTSDARLAQLVSRLDSIQGDRDRDIQALRDLVMARFDAGEQRVTDMRVMLDERYATQTKALDAAFLAQQTAMRTALDAAEKAVAAALDSAQTAVAKAETAAEARFSSVNEFRQQLSDQTASFPTRREVDTRFQALADLLEASRQRFGELELRLTSRLDLGAGAIAGEQAGKAERRMDTGQLVGIASAIAAFIAIAVTIIIATRGH